MNKWNAVLNNDSSYDGQFVYAVKTTKICCRPSCTSKLPLKVNVEYFDKVNDAVEEGYRPCKRCRPDLIEYNPDAETVKKMMDHLEKKLSKENHNLGYSEVNLNRLFKVQTGVTIDEYLNNLKVTKAIKLRKQKYSVNEIITLCNFGSVSTYYRQLRRFENE